MELQLLPSLLEASVASFNQISGIGHLNMSEAAHIKLSSKQGWSGISTGVSCFLALANCLRAGHR